MLRIRHRKLAIAAVLTWTLVVTVLRAVRLPNDFAEAHWLLDYRFGFVKRGLVGTIVSLLTGAVGARPGEQLIAVLSGAVFTVFCVVLLGLGLRVVRKAEWSATSALTVLAFVSSPFVVMSAHLVGYYDQIIIMFTVGSLALLLRRQIWLAAGMQTIAVLVHESAILIGFPVFALTWLLINSNASSPGRPRLALAPLVLPVATFVLIASSQRILLAPDFEQLYVGRLSEFTFIQDNRNVLVPRLLTFTLPEYLRMHGRGFAGRLSWLPMYGLVLPSMLSVLSFVLDAYRIRIASLQGTALLAVCLVPLTLLAVAVDTPRIWTYSLLCSFLVWSMYAETQPARSDRSPAIALLAIAALATNILGSTPLMDGRNDEFSLAARLLLYAPAIAATLALLGEDAAVRQTGRRR